MSTRIAVTTLAACLLFLPAISGQQDVFDRVTHGTAVSEGGVKIHYATLGSGPLVVMIHGFPDFWYTWRDQMAALSDAFQVVAIDQRGYNLSDKPKGVESYDMRLLVADVAAVVRHLGRDKATIVGHDWGGMVAWQFAMNLPQMTERLIVLNLPHPNGLLRELQVQPRSDSEQRIRAHVPARIRHGSQGLLWYADDAADSFGMGHRRGCAQALRRGLRALRLRRDAELLQGQLSEGVRRGLPPVPQFPKVTVPVLMFHGLDDRYLDRNGLSGTWDWIAKDLTLVTVPGAGHFVQQDASPLVSSTMKWWLTMRTR